MRYRHSVEELFDVCFVASAKGTTAEVREVHYMHADDSAYWAFNDGTSILYSNDDIFNTEKEDANCIIVFMK